MEVSGSGKKNYTQSSTQPGVKDTTGQKWKKAHIQMNVSLEFDISHALPLQPADTPLP